MFFKSKFPRSILKNINLLKYIYTLKKKIKNYNVLNCEMSNITKPDLVQNTRTWLQLKGKKKKNDLSKKQFDAQFQYLWRYNNDAVLLKARGNKKKK